MTILKITTIAIAGILLSFTPQKTPLVSLHAPLVFHKTVSIEWKRMEIELGNIEQNKPVTVEFEFKNTGELPVVISSVQASCGCTSTNYSKTPVLPGQTTQISATYNAAAKGNFKKTVSVVTSAKTTPETLVLSGTVI